MALDLPAGAHCFVDANIFYYHHVETPPFSDACSDFIARIESGVLTASASPHVLAETVHKIMLAEAAQRFGLGRAGLVRWLQEHRARLRELGVFRAAAEELHRLPLSLLPLDGPLLVAAATVSQQRGLLTNDALVVALMQQHHLSHLATNDDDFDGLPGIVVWKPR